MIVSYQYDAKGRIYASVKGTSIPPCTNQLLFYEETDPQIYGMIYKNGLLYAPLLDEHGSNMYDEAGQYVINPGVNPTPLPQTI